MKKVLLITVMILTLAIVGGKMYNTFRFDENNYTFHSYEIQKGDTLWELAEENVSDKDSVTGWINAVKKLNHCSNDITRGDYIIIYCAK